jgi:flagellar biosynthesis GTPase FlhF
MSKAARLKWIFQRAPLPMLAASASYGVYQFALLYVPWWVAMMQASAFELTYIGLATIEAKNEQERRKARYISMGTVVVSVLYNSLAGFFERNGLDTLPFWGEVLLAALHGAPLAIVAYLVAELLLHANQEQAAAEQEQGSSAPKQVASRAAPALPALAQELAREQEQRARLLSSEQGEQPAAEQKQESKQEQVAEQSNEQKQEQSVPCRYGCGRAFGTQKAENAHGRGCALNPVNKQVETAVVAVATNGNGRH